MKQAEIAKLIRRRYRISQRSAKTYAKAKSAPLMHYHHGAMGVCLCLLDDIGAELREPKRRLTPGGSR